jgi:hypothetical protein
MAPSWCFGKVVKESAYRSGEFHLIPAWKAGLKEVNKILSYLSLTRVEHPDRQTFTRQPKFFYSQPAHASPPKI